MNDRKPHIPRWRVALMTICIGILGSFLAQAQDNPPPPPDVNQSLPPDTAIVDAQASLESAFSCTFPQSVDPTNFQQSNSTLMSLPTSPSDAEITSSAQRIGPTSNPTADPVAASGEFVINKTHLSFAGFGVNYEFTLHYRSRINHQSPVGFGWSHNYARHIEDLSPKGVPDCAGEVYYLSDNMERITFRPNGTTYDPNVIVFKAASSAPYSLERHLKDDSYVLRDGSGLGYHFARSSNPGISLLDRVQDATGHAVLIHWDESIKNGDGGIVTSVTDTVGRVFYYNYSYQNGQLIPDDAPVDTGITCGTVTAGQYVFPDYKCLADLATAEKAARMGKFALLSCISLKKDDCSSPLLSFRQTQPDVRTEFDLTSVLDANGNGPTFSYYIQPEVGNYIPDEELISSCHTVCDTKATASQWSCHNLDFCGEKAIQDALSSMCDGVGFLPTQGSNGYSCTTYASHACGDADGKCYSQNWYTDHYGHWYSGEKMLCPYDDGNLNTSKALPEPLRNAACDGWLADSLSFCNSPLPNVLALRKAPFIFGGGYSVVVDGHTRTVDDVFCQQYLKGSAGDEISDSQVCNQYATDCRVEMEPVVRAAFGTCPHDCFQKCRTEKGAKDAKNARRYAFGTPQDLNHNLVNVYDGDGRLVVQNSYGIDPFQPSFDRIVKHQETDTIADNKITYDYHELRGEQALSGKEYLPYLRELGLSEEELFSQVLCLATDGCVPYYTATPDPQHVVPLSQFGSTEVCPSICTKLGPNLPPVQYPAYGMVPWNVIDPAKTGYFYNGDPIVLQAGADGTFSMVGAQPAPAHQAGDVLFSESLPQGRVAVTTSDRPGVLLLQGDPLALDRLFGPSNTVILRQAPSGKLIRDARNVSPRSTPMTLAEATQPAPMSPPTGRLVKQALLESPSASSVKSSKAGSTAEVKEQSSKAAAGVIRASSLRDRFASIGFAQGLSAGTAPLVLHRNGNVATIGEALAPGAILAQPKVPGGETVSILATSDPQKFSLRGATAAVTDDKGRVGIVILSNGDAYLVPARALLNDGGSPPQQMSAEQGILTGIFTEGMVCQKWETGPAAVTAGTATDLQLPEHAVVVHDLHGVARTNYFDKEWRLLREVNLSANETTNYNYKYGTLRGLQFSSGKRACQQADIFGKPTEVITLPAPNYPGDAQPQVVRFAYSPNEQLVDKWVDPGLPTESHVHLQRDQWDRVTWIDTSIDEKTTERIRFDYAPVAQGQPQAVFPIRVTHPDGSQTQMTMDASAGGPSATVAPVSGDTPLVLYAKYDAMGRLMEKGRTNHQGSVSKIMYDPAGLPLQNQVADVLNPGSFLSTTTEYNASQQPSHVSDPLVNRYYQYDPYDHMTVEVDVPRDGKTAGKSTCNHFAVDGRLEYSISPEGIATVNSYDAAGRLTEVDRGHPPDLSAWTSACLNGKRGPGSPGLQEALIGKGALLGNGQTPQQAMQALLHPSNLLSGGAMAQAQPFRSTQVGAFTVHAFNSIGEVFLNVPKLPGAQSPGAIAIPNAPPRPSWPSKTPKNDPGMQTIRLIKYAPGGFVISDTDGSGVGKYVITDGFGRAIDEMNGDPTKQDPAVLVHHWRGYDTRDRLVWEAVLGPNAPAYARPKAFFPALQSMVEYYYDGLGRRARSDSWFFANGKPAGKDLITSTKVTYDDASRRVVTQVDQHPAHIQEFDELGRMTSETLPNGIVTTTQYNEVLGGDTQIRTGPGPDGKAIVLTDTYDDRGLLLSTFQGKDELLRQSYDSFGRLVNKRALQSVTTIYNYDSFSRLISTTQDAAPSPNRVNQFAYDRDDRRVATSAVNAIGVGTTTETFDGIDRLIATQDPLQRITSFDYYPNSSRLYHTTDPQGTVTTLSYDFAGRLTTQAMTPGRVQGLDPKAVSRTFSYAPLGGIASAAITSNPADAANNLKVSLEYDSLGNRTRESYNGFLPISITRAFDSFGKPVATGLLDGGGATLATISRGFDELHRLAAVSLNQTPVASFTYAGIGGPTQINFGARVADPKSVKGVTAAIAYDFRGRRTGIDVTNAAGVVVAQHEVLGLDGIPRARTRQFGPNAAQMVDVFEIDHAARLIKEGSQVGAPVFPARELNNADVDIFVSKGQQHSVYTLDGNANWQRVSTERGDSDVQSDVGDEYLKFGNEVIQNDGVGQTASIGDDSYIFDGFGQLTSAQSKGVTVKYSYDALGRRVVETTSVQNRPDVSVFVLWDGSQILGVGDSQQSASAYRLRIGGSGINSHLALADHLGANGITYYMHQATEGSVIAITNDSGLVEGYTYSAFGETHFLNADGNPAQDNSNQPLAASAAGNRFLYQGQLYDPSPALYSMRAREYHPRIGRFLSLDPLRYKGSDNPYAFVSGMPLTLTDPFGMASQRAVDDTIMTSADANMSIGPPPAPPVNMSMASGPDDNSSNTSTGPGVNTAGDTQPHSWLRDAWDWFKNDTEWPPGPASAWDPPNNVPVDQTTRISQAEPDRPVLPKSALYDDWTPSWEWESPNGKPLDWDVKNFVGVAPSLVGALVPETPLVLVREELRVDAQSVADLKTGIAARYQTVNAFVDLDTGERFMTANSGSPLSVAQSGLAEDLGYTPLGLRLAGPDKIHAEDIMHQFADLSEPQLGRVAFETSWSICPQCQLSIDWNRFTSGSPLK